MTNRMTTKVLSSHPHINAVRPIKHYLILYPLIVTGSPANLTYSRDHILTAVQLDWSPSVMVNVVPVYQLFITNSDGITTNNVTSNDYIELSLQLDSEYNITLVATGEDLPSNILSVTIPRLQGNSYSLDTGSGFLISLC